jgi:hypothetical protein
MEGYCIALSKPTRKLIPLLVVFYNSTPWVYIIGGVLFMAKTTQYICNTLRKVSQKYIGLHNISFQTWRGIS